MNCNMSSYCNDLRTAYADSPIGWAVIDSLEQNGTTGGGNG